MTIAVMETGVCACGREYVVFQPERLEMAEAVSRSAMGRLDVFICNVPEAACSWCGRVIQLPVPELLDPERHGLGDLLDADEAMDA